MALTLKVDNGEFIFSGRSMQITKDKNALLKDYNKHCDYKNKDLTLKDREWTCPICGNHLDRDENAKNNLIKEGIRILETELNVAII